MNYSLLCFFFFRNKSRKDARTGMYLRQLMICFIVFLGGRTLNNAPLADSNSRWKPAAVGCSLTVDVLQRVFCHSFDDRPRIKRRKLMRVGHFFYAEIVASVFDPWCVCISSRCKLRFSLTTDRIRSPGEDRSALLLLF